MDFQEMFSFIVPNQTLSLHTVGTIYNMDWEQQCGCNGARTAHATEELVTQHDSHVKTLDSENEEVSGM